MKSEDAREKLKASILRAYRDYSEDADGIKDNHPVERVQTRSSKRASRVSPGQAMASLSLTDGVSKGHKNAHSPFAAHRTKRRKTRAERDKLHNKAKHKEAADVKLHHRKIQERKEITVTKIDLSAIERSSSSAVTQNRLTRRLGLFNKVKTSDTILREPLVVPASVKKKADADLQKVIGPGGDANFYTIDLDSLGKRFDVGKVHNVVTDVPLATPQPGSAKSSYTLPGSHSPQHPNLPTHIQDSPENLPSSPDLADIAERLQSSVHIRQHFPGKHYKQDIQEGLARLLKENAPAVVTPNLTPIKGAVVSQSAKRKLTDSMPPPQDQDCGPAPMDCNGSRKNTPAEPLSSHLSSQNEDLQEVVGMDARSLIGYNDKVRSSQEMEGSQDSGQSQGLLHGNSLPAQYTLRTSGSLNDLRLEDRQQHTALHTPADHCYFVPQRDELPMYAYPVILSEPQLRHPQVGDRPAVVAQYLYPNLPMDLSKTVYSHQLQNPEERMDILDVLDQESQLPVVHDTISLLHQHQHRLYHGKSQHEAACCHGDARRNIKCCHGNHQDKPASPVWPKGSAHLLQKPNLDTPSPPDKMYPRRLY